MKTKLGPLLRAIRNSRNLTIKDVAAKAGVSSSLLSQIERNRISPSLDTLLQLLEWLPLDWLSPQRVSYLNPLR